MQNASRADQTALYDDVTLVERVQDGREGRAVSNIVDDIRLGLDGTDVLAASNERNGKIIQVLVLDSKPNAEQSLADMDCEDSFVDADPAWEDEEDVAYPKWMRANFPSEELIDIDGLRDQQQAVMTTYDAIYAQEVRDPRACSECNKRVAQFNCKSCELALCFTCTDAIHIINAFASHAITRKTDHEGQNQAHDSEDTPQPRSDANPPTPLPAPIVSTANAFDAKAVDPSVRKFFPPNQVEYRLHLPIGTKLFFRAVDCGRWSRELLHGTVIGLGHGVRSTVDSSASEPSFFYRVVWLRGVETLANGFFRANLLMPSPFWPIEIGLYPSQLSAFRAVLTAERLARAAFRRERVSGRWHEPTVRQAAVFPTSATVNEILDETETILGHEFRTRLTQQDDAAFLQALSSGLWQYDQWMQQIGRADELREEAAATHEVDVELRVMKTGNSDTSLSLAAELLLLWSPRDRVRFFLLEQHELLLPEPVRRSHVERIIRQMLFVYLGFAWRRWRKFTTRHRRLELHHRREAAGFKVTQWWRRRGQERRRRFLFQHTLIASPLDALTLYRKRQDEAAKLYAFITRQYEEKQRRALRLWAQHTIGTEKARRDRQAREAATAAAARGVWHPSHGILSLPRLPRVYAYKKPDGGVGIEDLQRYKQFRAAHAGPTESSYWIIRQRVLMGVYPAGAPAFRDARHVVSRADYTASILLEQIGTFVCLAEPSELHHHEPSVDASSLMQLQQYRKQQRERRDRQAGSTNPSDAHQNAESLRGTTTYQTPWLFERIVRAKHALLHVELEGAVKVSERHARLAQRELDDLLAALPVPLDEASLSPETRAERERLANLVALADQNVRKARESLAQLRPLSFVQFPIAKDGVPDDAPALETFLQGLEDRLRRQERLYVFSMHGHGRTGFVATLLLGRLYGLTATDALERAQRHHDCQYAMHGVRATQMVSSPHAAPQITLATQLLAQYNDAIYARVVSENSDESFVQWRAQQRGLPLDKHATRDGFLVSDRVDETAQRTQQREIETLRRVAQRESAATRLRFTRQQQQREREAMARDDPAGG